MLQYEQLSRFGRPPKQLEVDMKGPVEPIQGLSSEQDPKMR